MSVTSNTRNTTSAAPMIVPTTPWPAGNWSMRPAIFDAELDEPRANVVAVQKIEHARAFHLGRFALDGLFGRDQPSVGDPDGNRCGKHHHSHRNCKCSGNTSKRLHRPISPRLHFGEGFSATKVYKRLTGRLSADRLVAELRLSPSINADRAR